MAPEIWQCESSGTNPLLPNLQIHEKCNREPLPCYEEAGNKCRMEGGTDNKLTGDTGSGVKEPTRRVEEGRSYKLPPL